MYPPPRPELGQETIRELDDQFFTSDPHAYVRSRITMLLAADRSASGSAAGDEFKRLLGPAAVNYEQVDGRAIKLQIAVDAFALRHQVAESLVRLLHVVLHHKTGHSHWVELIDTPTKNADVMMQNREVLDAHEDGGAKVIYAALLGPRPDGSGGGSAENASDDDLLERGVATHVSWINYAIQLLLQRNPDLNAAHNKFKHGMGLRPQDDILTTVTKTPPRSDGGVPLSALAGKHAVNLFDGVTTEFIARTDASKKHGLEATQIVMMPGPTLVEAAAMAHTLALLFHTAAELHFSDHEPHMGRSIPTHPGLLVDGPRPGTLRPDRPFALRFPLTTPLRGDAEPLLFWTDGHVQTLKFGKRIRGFVIDDSQHGDDDDG